jgi:uridine kinase
MVEIICTNGKNGENIKANFPMGTSLKTIIKELNIKLEFPILGAMVNNKIKELDYQVFKPKNIEFIDVTHTVGFQMYLRSLNFIMYKAVKDLFPDANLLITHPISGGKYCEIEGAPNLSNGDLATMVRNRMQEIIDKDLPFQRMEIPTQEAIEIFKENNLYEKKQLFKYRSSFYTSVYKLDDVINYYYGYLVPSTSYINIFNLTTFHNGLLLQGVSRGNPTKTPGIYSQTKLFNIFQEYKNWVKIMGVSYVGDLNERVADKSVSDLINISEALHEKKIASIADEIEARKDVKIVLVSGPSSSGKTTFSKRLSVQLAVLGYKPIQLSMDNYFVEREDTPKDANGEYDFECLQALDLELFNTQIKGLLMGEELEVPTFDFTLGKKVYDGSTMKLPENSILIIEGIHALNPELTAQIDENLKYKVFVSALTQISIDSQNPIPTTDNRLIRRMVRDYRYRSYSGIDTLKRWASVRKGEEKWIFPFQENADIMFNSALIPELGVLRAYAEPILREIPESAPEYAEAVRILKFLSYFRPVPEKDIPKTSILREFFGGSSFSY